MTSKLTAIVIIVAVVFAGAGFYGGIMYQKSKTPSFALRTAGGAGFAGRRTGANGASFLNGQVMSINGSTMTVKLMNGGSQIVILAPSTAYRKAVDGAASDLSVGNNVIVTGSANSDGSITAQGVQIRSASSTPPGMPGQ